MPATYEPIATTTLGSVAATITFSSIAASWTDLKLVLVGTAAIGISPQLRFNSDSGSNYSETTLEGTGTGAVSGRNTGMSQINLGQNGLSTTIPNFCSADIFSYAGSTNKTVLVTFSSDRNGSGFVERAVGLWRNTAAITTVTIAAASSTFSIGTTATLYGIKAA